MEHDDKYERARKRVKELKEFYQHLIVYLFVNIFIFIINVLTSPGHWWFIFPLFGWGIGLTAHALSTFSGGLFSRRWEERKIKEYMDKDER